MKIVLIAAVTFAITLGGCGFKTTINTETVRANFAPAADARQQSESVCPACDEIIPAPADKTEQIMGLESLHIALVKQQHTKPSILTRFWSWLKNDQTKIQGSIAIPTRAAP